MKKNNGFTLIELLVVIAIIGVLTSVILVVLNGTRDKGNDAKVQSQLKSMVSQAQFFTGTTTGYYSPSPTPPLPTTPSVPSHATAILFNDSAEGSNSLWKLLSSMPSGGRLYCGWDGDIPLLGGKWFVAVGTTEGASCVDYTGLLNNKQGTTPTTRAGFLTFFPNTSPANGYSCAD